MMRTVNKWKWVLSYVGVILSGISPSDAPAADINWNGFGSFYYGQALNRNLLPHGLTDNHADFTTFSLMGLNVSAKVDDNLDFAGQLVALGSAIGTADKFSLIAQWAYASYKPTEDFTIKVGRQLYPIYIASEYARVGYLLPFRQIPSTAFLISPFTRFDGVSAAYALETGLGKLTIGAFGGSPVLDLDTSTLALVSETTDIANLLGGQLTLDGDGWRVRAMASRNYTAVSSSTGAFNTLSGHQQTYSLGYRFDKYNVVSWGEYSMVRTPDGTPTGQGRYIGVGHSYYLLGGYRFGRFMPRYMFSQGSASFNFPYGPISVANGEVTTHTIGLNYQAGQQVTIKVEFEHDVLPSPPGSMGYFATQPAGATDTSGDAFFVGVDFIF